MAIRKVFVSERVVFWVEVPVLSRPKTGPPTLSYETQNLRDSHSLTEGHLRYKTRAPFRNEQPSNQTVANGRRRWEATEGEREREMGPLINRFL